MDSDQTETNKKSNDKQSITNGSVTESCDDTEKTLDCPINNSILPSNLPS